MRDVSVIDVALNTVVFVFSLLVLWCGGGCVCLCVCLCCLASALFFVL